MLVRRCIAGDAVAWEEIVRTYNRRIYNICYRFAGSGDDAEDLTQEVFIKMYRTLTSLRSHQRRVCDVGDDNYAQFAGRPFPQRQAGAPDRLDRRHFRARGRVPLSEQIQDQSAPPDAHVRSREVEETVHAALGKAFPRAAGSSDSKGLTGYGLSRNRNRFEGSGGYREIQNKSRSSGTCAPLTTYL